jgi:predicted TPR repeat methyltransferase
MVQQSPEAGAPALRDHVNEFIDDAAAVTFEDTVWWYVGRRAILRRFLERARREHPIDRIVELGCGSGPHFDLLRQYGELTGVEHSPILAARASARGTAAAVLTRDCTALDFTHDFDLTCAFDVLEHIADDRGFLQRLRQRVAAEHLLLLSVPACPFLYGPHDRLLHHHRRYAKRSLRRLLDETGWSVLSDSFFMTALFPAAVATRLVDRLMAALGRERHSVELGVVPDRLNGWLVRVLEAEAALSAAVPLPIGLWLVALARAR